MMSLVSYEVSGTMKKENRIMISVSRKTLIIDIDNKLYSGPVNHQLEKSAISLTFEVALFL